MIGERVRVVREKIARAADRAGRSPRDVTLVAVSKTKPPEAVRDAFAAGVRDFGENRIQEAEAKIGALRDLPGIRWHLVGHLQGNKARKAAGLFGLIHSVDGIDLGRRLDRVASEEGRVMSVLLEVELGGEATKHGLPEGQVLSTLESLRALPSLRVDGLMCVPPFAENPEYTRIFFRRCRELRDRALGADLLRGSHLSMGMSHDLEVAVEEGATFVRVGTALFGERGPAR